MPHAERLLSTKRLRAFLRTFVAEFKDAQIALVASSLAYTTILSIVPFLAVSFSIFQAFKGLDKVYLSIEPYLLENLAESAGQSAIESIKTFITNIHAGTLGITGLVILIFTSMTMLSNAEKAINRIWKTETRRPLFARISSYWLFITLGPVSIAAALGIGGFSEGKPKIMPAGFTGLIMTAIFLTAIYKWVPNRKVRWGPATFSAFVTSILFSLTKAGYSVYITNVVSYNKIYGSLGAIPIMILWIYLVWVVVLSGAALSASLQFNIERHS